MALVAVDGKLVTVEGKAIQLDATVAGKDGTTFTPSVSEGGDLSWTNDGGKENPATVNIKGLQGEPGKDGSPGKDGKDGTNGVTFTPSVSDAGLLSWTNDGGKANPQAVNIKGPQGEPGADGKTPVKGTDYFTAADVAEIAQEAAGEIDLSGKLDKTGDGSDVTVSFTPPGATGKRANLTSGEKLSAALAKVYQWFANLGTLAFKSSVAKSDLASDVQTSLGKADSALQSAPVTSVNGQTGAVQLDISSAVSPSDATPQAPTESGSAGTAATYARGDHKHPKEVFWATRDSTTYAEIKAAYDAGKIIFAKNQGGNAKFQLVNARDNYFVFSTLYANGSNDRLFAESNTVIDGQTHWNVDDVYLEPLLRKYTLSASGWDGTTKQQAVTVSGILADRTKQEIIVAPVDASYNSAWNSCGIRCVGQAQNKLTFQCSTIPTEDIEVYVTVRSVYYQSA